MFSLKKVTTEWSESVSLWVTFIESYKVKLHRNIKQKDVLLQVKFIASCKVKLHEKIKQKNVFLLKISVWNEFKLIPCFCCYSCLMVNCLSWVSGPTWPTSSQCARCPHCMRVFVNNTNLKIHIRDVHSIDKGPFICNKCGKIVKNRGSLRVHTYRFHTPKT